MLIRRLALDEALATLPSAAGIQFITPTGHALFLKRGAKSNHPGTWCWPGGGIEGDETPEQAARREASEEIGFKAKQELSTIDHEANDEVAFTTFGQNVPETFVPQLNEEHVEHTWAPLSDPPQPLHPGAARTIERQLALMSMDSDQPGVKHDPSNGQFTTSEGSEHGEKHVVGNKEKKGTHLEIHHAGNHIGSVKSSVSTEYEPSGKGNYASAKKDVVRYRAHYKHSNQPASYHKNKEEAVAEVQKRHQREMEKNKANDSYAFDRATVRRIDPANGHMHVATTNISKANVCPYLGREIPGWQELGLQADKIYNLYRDPEELTKAAPTFNNLPLLRRHVENTADNHNKEDVIGSTGTDASFEQPYLINSLVVWDGPYIEAIEDESQKELSSAYRYRADMTPGESPSGEKFDGVMRDIIGNHVALVKEGRAGSDVVVGDSKEELNMAKAALSLKAVMARGALAAFLAPKLAQDAKIPLTSILAGVNAKNFSEKKPAILKGLNDAIKGKLAKDEKSDGLAALLDALVDTPVVDDADPMEDATFNQDDLDAGVNPSNESVDDPLLKAKDDPMDAVKKFLAGKLSPEDMAQIEKLCSGDGSAMDNPIPPAIAPKAEEGAKDKDMVTKEDMDKAVKGAQDAAIKAQQEIRSAEKLIAPYVGELSQSYGSASEIIKHALMAMDVKGVEKINDVDALTVILHQQKKPGERTSTKVSNFAMDAKGASSFAERHPGASRIQIA